MGAVFILSLSTGFAENTLPFKQNFTNNMLVSDFFTTNKIASDSITSASWQTTQGPIGGIVNNIYASSTNNLFTAIAGGGIYRSENGGAWTALPAIPNETRPITQLGLNAKNNRLYAATSGPLVLTKRFLLRFIKLLIMVQPDIM